jgi:uracil-DNA glycosylase
MSESLDELVARLRKCRICKDLPRFGPPLPHEPRPVIQAAASARILIAGQAPGTRVHASGRPFTDPSGVRLRGWLGMDEASFYDASHVAVVPMGHCFPGHDAQGGDLPPQRECAPEWRAKILEKLPNLELALLIGHHAQAWHLTPSERAGGMTATVGRWRQILEASGKMRRIPLPHPSWRNNGWLKANPWFEAELVPVLRAHVARLPRAAAPV